MSTRLHGVTDHEAAKESNLPSGGLHRPADFEGQMGHQTPAAPCRLPVWRKRFVEPFAGRPSTSDSRGVVLKARLGLPIVRA